MLDELIKDSRDALKAIRGANSSALYFWGSNEGVPITSSSHIPMKAFRSEWFGKSIDEIHDYFKKVFCGENNGFCDHTFAILDDESLKILTLLLASDKEGPLITARSDFWSSLHAMVPVEMGRRSMSQNKDQGVQTRERTIKVAEEYHRMVQGKGEPLKDIEKLITGIDD